MRNDTDGETNKHTVQKKLPVTNENVETASVRLRCFTPMEEKGVARGKSPTRNGTPSISSCLPAGTDT